MCTPRLHSSLVMEIWFKVLEIHCSTCVRSLVYITCIKGAYNFQHLRNISPVKGGSCLHNNHQRALCRDRKLKAHLWRLCILPSCFFYPCRWLKFEEDVEDGGERWSKPYVATLSLHSLFELRSCIMNGTVMLDMRANSLEEIAGEHSVVQTYQFVLHIGQN